MAERRDAKPNIIIFLLMTAFIYYAISLSYSEGSNNHIVTCLFYMILILGVLLFILNKEKIKKEGVKLKQTYLEEYCNKKK